jgi:hypothetical protein
MSIANLAGSFIQQNDDGRVADIITFCEAPWGLNMNLKTGNTTLRPVQKLVMKCYYNLELDNKEKSIIVRDFLNEEEKYRFTEQEYLHFLYNEGRTNIKEVGSKLRNELVLVAGRRGGKCLKEGTLILTPKGPVEIEKIKAGDTVYGYNADGSVSPTKVLNVADQGIQEVVDLTSGTEVIQTCTFNHKWLTIDEINDKKTEKTPSTFCKREGNQYANIVRKIIKIPCGDVEESHAYGIGKYPWGKIVDLDVVKKWNRESLLNFLAGFLDTDGSVSVSENTISIEFFCQSKSILEAVDYAFLTLFQYKLNWSIDKRDVNETVYRLRMKNNFFAKAALRELNDYLVNPARKWKPEYESFLENNSNPYYVGVKLGKKYEARTYDIEVDNETSLYVLANQGLVTHNSKLGAIVSAYEAYSLIKKQHPQRAYGLTDNAEIYLTTVATSTEQAELLFNDIAAYIDSSQFFNRYKNDPTLQFMKLRSPYDIENSGQDGRTSIIIKAAPCSGRGLRGMANIVIIMDEQAHFIDSSTNKSDAAIYEAVTPSTLSFGKDARILNISSPLNKQGKLWELYNASFQSEKILMFQIPTWELYPQVDSSELRERYRRNPDVYWCEIGAKFSDTVKSWMPVEQLVKCIEPTLKPKLRGLPKTEHFMGIDIGLKKDQTAITVLHVENKREPVFNVNGQLIDEIIVPKYELDYQEVLQAGVGKHVGREFLDFDNIADRIESVCKDFMVVKGLFDQYNGVPLMQSLQKKGLNQFSMVYFDRRFNSELYNNFMLQVIDGKLVLFDDPESSQPLAEGKHGPFISEIIDLQSEFISKYITQVFAPEIEGKHDDRSDSFVRALWCATEWLTKNKDNSGQFLPSLQFTENGNSSGMQARKHRPYMNQRVGTSNNRASPYSVFFNKRGRR